MICPKCGSRNTYKFSGPFHCKSCDMSWTEWQQQRISELEVALDAQKHWAAQNSRLNQDAFDMMQAERDKLATALRKARELLAAEPFDDIDAWHLKRDAFLEKVKDE